MQYRPKLIVRIIPKTENKLIRSYTLFLFIIHEIENELIRSSWISLNNNFFIIHKTGNHKTIFTSLNLNIRKKLRNQRER